MIEGLDPGITCLVHILVDEWGYETCDSGDGVSKPEDARTIEGPHVVMHAGKPSTAGKRLTKLIWILKHIGVTAPYEITITYASDGPMLMMLCGISDADLRPE